MGIPACVANSKVGEHRFYLHHFSTENWGLLYGMLVKYCLTNSESRVLSKINTLHLLTMLNEILSTHTHMILNIEKWRYNACKWHQYIIMYRFVSPLPVVWLSLMRLPICYHDIVVSLSYSLIQIDDTQNITCLLFTKIFCDAMLIFGSSDPYSDIFPITILILLTDKKIYGRKYSRLVQRFLRGAWPIYGQML